MSLNYAELASNMVNKNKSYKGERRGQNQTRNQNFNPNNGPDTRTCYKCGERGHLARGCLSETDKRVLEG